VLASLAKVATHACRLKQQATATQEAMFSRDPFSIIRIFCASSSRES
jgi:hypothetical protein